MSLATGSWNTIDWMIAAVLAWGSFQGLRRGLIRGLFSLIALVLGYMVAIRFNTPLVAYFEQSFQATSRIAHWIEGRLPPSIQDMGWSAVEHVGTDGMINALNLPPAYAGWIQEQIEQTAVTASAGSATPTVGASISQMMAEAALAAVAFFILFVATRWLVMLVSETLAWVVPTGIDRAAGLGFGLIQSGVLTALVLIVMMPVIGGTDVLGISDALEHSVAVQWLTDTAGTEIQKLMSSVW